MLDSALSAPHELVIIIPCFNEEATVAETVTEYANEFPESCIIVVDNNSTDRTKERAQAVLRPGDHYLLEREQGKGAAMRTGLLHRVARTYLVTDGDLTYPASDARIVVDKLRNDRLDMVVGDRLTNGGYAAQNDRRGHSAGNAFLTSAISFFLKRRYTDVLSGLRAFSAPFVDSIVLTANGFQVETELNIAAAYLNAKVEEVPISYGSRPEGSESKLNTYRDGFRILYAAFIGGMQVRPMVFFGTLTVFFAVLALGSGGAVTVSFLNSGEMTRPGLAVLASAFGILSALSLFTGLILSGIGQSIRDKRIADFGALKRKWIA